MALLLLESAIEHKAALSAADMVTVGRLPAICPRMSLVGAPVTDELQVAFRALTM